MGLYLCNGCGSSDIPEKDWKDHIQTRKHVKASEESFYSKEIFDSNLISKQPLVFSFMPKTPWLEQLRKL